MSVPRRTSEGLQITEEWNDSRAGDYLWSNVNFGEAVTGVMTPLSWSVLRLVLEDWRFIPEYSSVGNIGGRPYLNITAFASVLHALGRGRQEILDTLEGTLYMRLPEELEIPLIPVSKWSLVSILPNVIRVQARQRRGVQRLPAYVAENPAWCRQMQQQIQAVRTAAQLRSLWHEELHPHLTDTVWIVLGSATHATDYSMDLRRELTELVGPDDANSLLSNATEGSDILASLGPAVGLANVARGTLSREEYLEHYGHRGPHEFELSVPRPVEDPAWLDQQLSQLEEAPVDVEARLDRQRAEFDAAWKRLQAGNPRQSAAIRQRIHEAARRSRMREAARSEYVRDRWMARLFAVRAGELTGLEDDVFFLTMDEVLTALAGDDTAVNRIPERRETYERYKSLPAYPSIIRGQFDPLRWARGPNRRTDIYAAHARIPASAPDDARHGVITGAAGSAGRVEGTVRRLARPEEGAQLQPGEILVTTQTDIAWTPIFLRSAAVITDVGAPLSHAAIVARELGIPAVVGCGNATMRLRTGDQVRVDGGQGIVEILSAD